MPRAGLLHDPDFLKLWAGQAISQTGSAITYMGLTLTAVNILGASPLQMGILTVLFDVSYQAYVPALVNRDNILEANSKLALTESIAGIAGPGLGGILV